MMRLLLFLLMLSQLAQSQPGIKDSAAKPIFDLKGQMVAYGSYHFNAKPYWLLGGYALPEASYAIPLKKKRLLDFDLSLNLQGNAAFNDFEEIADNGNLDPYRAWARYSGKQFEIRVGLQKLNFGSASSLRPLRWFDQVDPRDPQQLTTGVWALLGRYYFLNNANIWLWGLYQNASVRGWDVMSSDADIPEFGGRFQWPIKKGEMAFTAHHRMVDTKVLRPLGFRQDNISEWRFGLDGKWDVEIGLWYEISSVHKQRNIGAISNQTLINVGADYTFALGNGLNVIAEHLLSSIDEAAYAFENNNNLTAFTVAYPVGMFSNVNALLFYNWGTNSANTYFRVQYDWPKITVHLMVFTNSTQQNLQQNELVNGLSGNGLQVLAVYNF